MDAVLKQRPQGGEGLWKRVGDYSGWSWEVSKGLCFMLLGFWGPWKRSGKLSLYAKCPCRPSFGLLHEELRSRA